MLQEETASRTVVPEELKEETANKPTKLLVLPLYAMLPAAAQMRVFQEPPEGYRLCVVATNVAETSITFPGVRLVLDCGCAMERGFLRSAVSASCLVLWFSKASAAQRAGRAGRTGPGHVDRLYSSAHFNDNFAEFALPEIQRVPIDGVVLQLKALGIDRVANFPFPSPPDLEALQEGQRILCAIGALKHLDGLLTPLGRDMAHFPLNPRHARLLLHAITEGGVKSVGQALRAAAVMSVDSPFLSEVHDSEGNNGKEKKSDAKTDADSSEKASEDDFDEDNVVGDDEESRQMKEEAEKRAEEARKQERKRRQGVARQKQAKFLDTESDVISAVNALQAFEEIKGPKSRWCHDHALRMKPLAEAHMLTQQLLRYFRVQSPTSCPLTDKLWIPMCL